MQKKKKRQKLIQLKRTVSELPAGGGESLEAGPKLLVAEEVNSVDDVVSIQKLEAVSGINNVDVSDACEAGGSRFELSTDVASIDVVASETHAFPEVDGASFYKPQNQLKCVTCTVVKEQLETVKFEYMKLETKLAEAFREAKKSKKQLKLDEKRMERVELECQRKINSIRSFWKDKIYRETTRAGKIVKVGMQKTSPYLRYCSYEL